jgi:hypothetical protein
MRVSKTFTAASGSGDSRRQHVRACVSTRSCGVRSSMITDSMGTGGVSSPPLNPLRVVVGVVSVVQQWGTSADFHVIGVASFDRIGWQNSLLKHSASLRRLVQQHNGDVPPDYFASVPPRCEVGL